MKEKTIKFKRRVVGLAGLMMIVPLLWAATLKFEGRAPSIHLERSSFSFGESQNITGTVSDQKNGIRGLRIALIKDRREVVLLEKHFPSGGFFSFNTGDPHTESFDFKFEPKKLGLSDGRAILRMVARDASWRAWGRGNLTYQEKEVVIDTRPPEIKILTKQHYISQGGAGLVIYSISEPCLKNSVVVGEKYFPGHPGYFTDPNIFLAFMAIDVRQSPDAKIFIEAVDRAGNRNKAGLSCHVRKKRFKKDTLRIPDGFLREKKEEFEKMISGGDGRKPLDIFIEINRKVRRANMETFAEIGAVIEPILHWEGKFLRLPGSATKARFADHRTYQYKGRIIDYQIHMGIDLASTEKTPVPAANRGKIVFSGELGIFGKTVVIDHGFGLHSVYSHLHRIDVQKGQMTAKGDIIGITGKTGLAGGDHLHFGVMIHGTFVNPLEWWDEAWIENNITGKIKAVASGSVR